MWVLVVLVSLVQVDSYLLAGAGEAEELLELLVAPRVEDRIQIRPPEPQRVVARQGENVTLSCHASHPWFLCLWVAPGEEKLCSIREEEGAEHRQVCGGVAGAELVARADSCHVTLTSVRPELAGDWLCLLSQAGSFHTDREVTSLSVASPASLDLTIQGISEEGASTLTLDMLEDEGVTIHCEARGGLPRPQFYWAMVMDEDEAGAGGWARMVEDASLGPNLTSVVTSSLSYTARREHGGRTLVCVAEQRDPDTGRLLYNASTGVRIAVEPRPEPGLAAYLTSHQQDVVAGAVISCFLVIFCVAIVIVFTVRSSKAANTPKAVGQTNPRCHESYIIFLEEDPSINQGGGDSSAKDPAKESGIDVSHGVFVSFNSSDLYSSKANSEVVTVTEEMTSSSEDQDPVSSSSHDGDSDETETSPHDESSDGGCAASEGGLSNISVFDCQHGCFHDQPDHPHYHLHHHQDQDHPHHHYLKDSVLNTDL